MNNILRCVGSFLLVFIVGASDAQEVYDSISPVVIQKDGRGRLAPEAERLLAGVMEEIAEHGTLRVWVEANTRYTQLEPSDPAYGPQMRRIRALQESIVSNLTSAMSDLSPGEALPSEGPFVAVTVDDAGAQALVDDRNVRAMCFLVPGY